jgi:hypothetical protein
MNLPFKRNYLQHAMVVSEWISRHGARGGIDARTQVMEITCNGRTVRFHPQFVIENADGSMGFAAQMLLNVSGFVGWMPYQGKAWPAAQDKLAFKELAQAHGMRTPKWTQDASQARGAVLVKARRSTLGRAQRGPYEMGLVGGVALSLAEGEYCEQFIAGRLVKAWFWNDELVVAEVVDMPTVRGDGLATLRQLIARRLGPSVPWPTAPDELADIQGMSLDSILGVGAVALADYRYMSVLNPALTADHNVRSQLSGTTIEAALLHAGNQVWSQIPEDARRDTAFSIDGVIDRAGDLWLLEANCNPLLHPAFYDLMLDRLFGVDSPTRR